MSVTIELPDELGDRLRVEAAKHGQALPEYTRQALEAMLATLPPEDAPTTTVRGPEYLEEILEAAHALPQEVVDQFPQLGAREVDHYVYGLPIRGSKSP